MKSPEKRWLGQLEAVLRARALRQYVAPSLVFLAGLTGTYWLLESEATVEDRPKPGEFFYVDLPGGDLSIDQTGEVQYYPSVLRVNRQWSYPQVSAYGDWDQTPEARLPWEWATVEEGFEFKPWLLCGRYWHSPMGSYRGKGEVNCGVRYIRIKPEGEDKVRVEVHFDEVGMFWRVVRLVQRGVEETERAVDKVKTVVVKEN